MNIKGGKKIFIGSALCVIAVMFFLVLAQKRSEHRQMDLPSEISKVASESSKNGHPSPAGSERLEPASKFISKILTGKIGLDSGYVITAEQAQAVLKQMKVDKKSLNDQSIISSAVLLFLCKQGNSEDAWNFIEPGPGLLRDANLGMFFRFSDLPIDSLIRKMESLDNPGDFSTSLRNVTRTHPLELVKNLIAGDLKLDAAQTQNFIDSVPTDRGKSTWDPLMKDMALLLTKGTISVDQYAQLAKHGIGEPFNQWDTLKAVGGALNSQDLEKCQQATVREMIIADPERAITSIINSDVAKKSDMVWSAAINAMYEADAGQANSWMENNLSKIDPVAGQIVIQNVAKVAINGGEYEVAGKWISRVQDEKIRTTLLSELQKKQK